MFVSTSETMKTVTTLLVALLLASVAAAERLSYKGYSVYRVQIENEVQFTSLIQLQRNGHFDFWDEARPKGPVDIIVSPAQLEHLDAILRHHGLNFDVMIPDLQPLMDATFPKTRKSSPKQGHNMDWDEFHDLADIYEFLNYTADNFDYVTKEVIGQSYEGRDMILLKICIGGCGNKPGIFIDSGMHSREWVAPAATTYMINQLTTAATGSEDFLTMLDWYILALANPDGYDYSWTVDRNWRKTRSVNDGSACLGTDMYHNFGFEWSTGDDNPCSEFYHGVTPFSEVEARNVQAFLDVHQYQLNFYENVHAYGQYVLTPWGYTTTPLPDYNDLEQLAYRGTEALHILYGTVYQYGSMYDVIGSFSTGVPMDYVKNLDTIKYAYEMYLRDTGEYGSLLPPEQILPTVRETWAYHTSVARDLIDEFVVTH